MTDRKKAKKRHLTEGMTQETLTDLTVLKDTDWGTGAGGAAEATRRFVVSG